MDTYTYHCSMIIAVEIIYVNIIDVQADLSVQIT